MEAFAELSLRRIVFWAHLATGVVAGSVILLMAVTGALLAFEPELAAVAERHLRSVPPPPSGTRPQPLDVVLASVRTAWPDTLPTRVTLRADPTESLRVSLVGESVVFVDPYTARVLGSSSGVRRALRTLVEWHRWLGSRELGRPLTGACNLAFLGLAVSGLTLWWPRTWSRRALVAVTVPDLRIGGKARDFNWHNAIGVWCAPVLIVLTLTGAVMSYTWANDLLYRLAGSTPPLSPAGETAVRRGLDDGSTRAAAVSPDVLEAARRFAERSAPGWVSMTLRLPTRPGAPVSVLIEEPGTRLVGARSQLTLDARTAAILRWEPFHEASPGRWLRAWVRPLHTGEALGVAGQLVAALASAGGAVLVFTGLSLAWRRLRACQARSRVAAPADVGAVAP